MGGKPKASSAFVTPYDVPQSACYDTDARPLDLAQGMRCLLRHTDTKVVGSQKAPSAFVDPHDSPRTVYDNANPSFLDGAQSMQATPRRFVSLGS
jgi:hypothetical protein